MQAPIGVVAAIMRDLGQPGAVGVDRVETPLEVAEQIPGFRWRSRCFPWR
jgi:hypothetical protein